MSTETHAEHLDQNYRYQRHVYDVTREYYLLGRRRLIGELEPPPEGSVLELGCGTALNLIRAQRRFPQANYYGVDLSRMMLETARASLSRRDLAGRIRLALADATGFDPEALFGQAVFDRVFFSYSLSMMPPWEAALEHAAKLLSAGGRLHIVDFGGCERLPPPVKRVLDAWLARFRVSPREDMEDVLSGLARRHGLTMSFERLYRGYSCYAVLERRIA
ncbi:MAG: class I SAM-dependent methyltransferase [Hyphomicrobiaceae bacterium]